MTSALGIGPDDKEAYLLDDGSAVRLHRGAAPVSVTAGPRVGITHAADLPWRFTETGAATVSPFRAGVRARRRVAGQDGHP